MWENFYFYLPQSNLIALKEGGADDKEMASFCEESFMTIQPQGE